MLSLTCCLNLILNSPVSVILTKSCFTRLMLSLYYFYKKNGDPRHKLLFSTSECNVMLEDMYMLLRLPIESKTTNGKTNFSNSIYEGLLGSNVLNDNSRGQCILLSRLKTYYNSLTLDENSIEESKIIKIRCYIMLLIGSLLFPKGSHSSMHFIYFTLLRHLRKIGTYS